MWIASRGFGGKTFLLALLAAANAILFETDVIILGGSGQQSIRVVEQLHRLWAAGQVPPAWLASAPTFNKTTLAWDNTKRSRAFRAHGLVGAFDAECLEFQDICQQRESGRGGPQGLFHTWRRCRVPRHDSDTMPSIPLEVKQNVPDPYFSTLIVGAM